MKESKRGKSALIGLYLAKFDIEGLNKLGFKGFSEAFNLMGLSIGAKPTTLKLYRDEFDPIFPNPRKGWHKRPMRDFCKEYYDRYGDLSLNNFSDLIKRIILKNYDLKHLENKIENKKEASDAFLKRTITGQAAENYFRNNYELVPIFKGLIIEDTTMVGCGFDFKVFSPDSNQFFGVEVKGLNEESGGILLTEKEYRVAKFMKDKYFIFLVKNLKDKPSYVYFQNPLNSELTFKKTERKIIEISYQVKI